MSSILMHLQIFFNKFHRTFSSINIFNKSTYIIITKYIYLITHFFIKENVAINAITNFKIIFSFITFLGFYLISTED